MMIGPPPTTTSSSSVDSSRISFSCVKLKNTKAPPFAAQHPQSAPLFKRDLRANWQAKSLKLVHFLVNAQLKVVNTISDCKEFHRIIDNPH